MPSRFTLHACISLCSRHHTVNSVWTLKALDNHVISDEEIIEDTVFRGHFLPLSSCLRIDLCPSLPPVSAKKINKSGN
jgi:hypothetical protein